MGFIYCVKLHEDKWYIYFTTESDLDYWEIDKNISEFIYHYDSIEIDSIIPNCDKYDTDKYVKKYMKKYGLDNVRGGSYNNLKLTSFEKEFIQKELDYIDIDDNKYNNKNKKKIEWIEDFKVQLKELTSGCWELIRREEYPTIPEYLPNKVFTRYNVPPLVLRTENIKNVRYMINDNFVKSLQGPIKYNSDNSFKNYRTLIQFTYNELYYEYKFKFSKKDEYNVDESTLHDIRCKEDDIKYKISLLENM